LRLWLEQVQLFYEKNQLNTNVLSNILSDISGQPWFMPGVWPLGHIGATIIKDKAGFQIKMGL